MKKLLCAALILCMLANAVGFAELADAEPVVGEEEELMLILDSDEDEDEEEAPAEAEAPATLTINMQNTEDGILLSVDAEGTVVWQAKEGTDVSAADEEGWKAVAEGSSITVAADADMLYRALLVVNENELVVSNIVAVTAAEETEAVEETEEETEPIAKEIDETPLDTGDEEDPAPAPTLVLSGSEILGGGKSVTLKVTLNGKAVKASALTWNCDNKDVATVSTAGKVTAKKVEDVTTVTITATDKKNTAIKGTLDITVSPATTKVTVTAAGDKKVIDLAANETLQLTAAVLPVLASKEVTWKTSSAKIATVDQNGLVSPVKAGKVTVTATAKDGTKKSGSIVLTVVNLLKDFEITGPDEVAQGKSITLKAVCDPTDATNKKFTWSSSDKTIATVSTSGVVKGSKTKLGEVTITATAADGTIVKTKTVKVCPVVKTVKIAKTETLIDLNSENSPLTLSATCEPSEASQSVTWKSSNTKIAVVDAKTGEVKPLKVGKVTITATATDGSKKSAKIVLNIVKKLKTLEITGPDAVAVGKSITLKAVYGPTDATNKKVTWESGDKTIATVSTSGVVKGNAKLTEQKEVTITVKSVEDGSIIATKEITVCPLVKTVTVKADKTFVDLATKEQIVLTATCLPDDASQSVTWKSSNTKIATVNAATGVVTPVKLGKVTITATATDGSKKSGTIVLNVVNAVQTIEVEGANAAYGGATVQLTAKITPDNATNKAVTWSSDDEEVATVDAKGKVTCKDVDTEKTVTITATAADGTKVKGEKVLTVTPIVKTIIIAARIPGTTIDLNDTTSLALTATVEPAAAAQKVNWASSDEEVATVDAEGNVTALKAGTATITATATDGSAVSGSVTLSFVKGVQTVVIEGDDTAICGATVQLTATITPDDATNKTLKWTSSNEDAATVDANGKVTCKNVEEAVTVTITATSEQNPEKKGEKTLTITPAVKTITISGADDGSTIDIGKPENKIIALTATVAPAAAAQSVTWTSSDEEVATVAEDGKVTPIKAGKVTITAAATDGSAVSGSVTLNFVCPVTDVFYVDDDDYDGYREALGGTSFQLKAEVYPKNATNQGIVWSTSDNSVATVDQNGKVTLSNPNETKSVFIYATAAENAGIYNTYELSVNPATERIVIRTMVPDDVTELDLNDRWGWDDFTFIVTAYPTGAEHDISVTVTDNAEIVREPDEANLDYALNLKEAGTLTITATANDGSGVTATKTFTLTKGSEAVPTPKLTVMQSGEGFEVIAAGNLPEGMQGGVRVETSATGEEGSYTLLGEQAAEIDSCYVEFYADALNVAEGATLYIRACMYATGDEEVTGRYVTQQVTFTDFDYRQDGSSVTITGYHGEDTAVTIPSTINGLPVISIEEFAFDDNKDVTSVTIPSSVTFVGNSAFMGCTLKDVTIPAALLGRFNDVFKDNSKTLETVTITEGTATIPANAFAGYGSLKTVNIPAGVTAISADAFFTCDSLTTIKVAADNTDYSSADGVLYSKDGTTLVACPKGKTSVTIPSTVTTILTHAFNECEALTAMVLPNSVKTIGGEAFKGCTALESVTLSNGLTVIPASAFESCKKLTSVTIPGGVKVIGQYAFMSCSALKTVNIAGSVTTIDVGAFADCAALTDVNLGSNVKDMGCQTASDAFTGCSNATFHCTAGTDTYRWLKATLPEGRIDAELETPIIPC